MRHVLHLGLLWLLLWHPSWLLALTQAEAMVYFKSLSPRHQQQARSQLYFDKIGTFYRHRKQGNLNLRSQRHGRHFKTLFTATVNKYLNDNDFRCHYPALHHFFEKTLTLQRPTPSASTCTPLNQVPVATYTGSSNLTSTYTTIDPARIYQIHFLQATPSNFLDNPAGGLGHSMLRLIVCNPKREKVSSDCLQDIEHHLVVDYLGEVTTPTTSPIKGVMGGYPSKLYFHTFLDIKDNYTLIEQRNLWSYPMNEALFDKELLLKKMIENVYLYKSTYYFFARNCVTELANLIRSASNNAQVQRIDGLRPHSLLQDLIAAHLIKPMKKPAEAQRKGLFWPHTGLEVSAATKTLNALIPDFQFTSLDAYLKQLPIETWNSVIQGWVNSVPEPKRPDAVFHLQRLEELRNRWLVAKRKFYIAFIKAMDAAGKGAKLKPEEQAIASFLRQYDQRFALTGLSELLTQEEFDAELEQRRKSWETQTDLEAKLAEIEETFARARPLLTAKLEASQEVKNLLATLITI